jgi:type VI protein secretion system component VasK
MRLEHVVSLAISQLMGRLIRRIAVMTVLALLVLVAIYHLTVAGTIALEQLYGPLIARLIIVAVYAALALIAVIYLYATRAREPEIKRHGTAKTPQDVQMAMLLDSILLGYTAARRKSRSS